MKGMELAAVVGDRCRSIAELLIDVALENRIPGG